MFTYERTCIFAIAIATRGATFFAIGLHLDFVGASGTTVGRGAGPEVPSASNTSRGEEASLFVQPAEAVQASRFMLAVLSVLV